jgi:hypothetical protein
MSLDTVGIRAFADAGRENVRRDSSPQLLRMTEDERSRLVSPLRSILAAES